MLVNLPLFLSSFLRRTWTLSIGLLAFISLPLSAWATDSEPAQAPMALAISVSSGSTTICAGTSTSLTVSGCPAGGAIRWSNEQTGASITVAPQQTTTYTVNCSVTSTSVTTTTATSSTATATTAIVTSVSTTTASATIQVGSAIVLTPALTPVTCNGRNDGRVVLNTTGGVGAVEYQFNGSAFQAGNAFGSLPAGTYPAVVRDGRGCTVRANITVTQPTPLSLTVTAVGAKCTGGSDGGLIAVASGGGGDYVYYLNNASPQQTGTYLDLKANTTYSVAATDKFECLVAQTVQIGAPTPFDIRPTVKPTQCAGSVDGSISVSVTGGSAPYQYQLGTGAFQAGGVFTGLSANTYELTVLDRSGCQSKSTIVVGQPSALSLTAASRPVNCFGPASGTITVSSAGGTGAVMYRLNNAGTPQTSNVFAGVGVGNYSIIGTDANGCSSPVSVTVGQAEPLKVQATSRAATCCVCPTGAVSVTSTGGTGTNRQYQVIGQAYQPSNVITGLRPNTYRLRVADEVGCTDSVVTVVADGAALTLAVGTVKNISCSGGSDGEAAVQVAGGTKPFTFYWQTERRDTLKTRTAAQTGLTEGTYTVSVLDSNRCTTGTVFVALKATNPSPFKPTISQSGSTLVVDQLTGIQWYVRTATEPAKPVQGQTQPTLVPFQSGEYYAVITANGCPSPPSNAINFILTALSEPANGLSIQVAPNPVVDRLHLEIEQVERTTVHLELLDATGRTVRQEQLPAFTGKRQAEWPLMGVPTGVYLLKANAGTRQSTVRLVVK